MRERERKTERKKRRQRASKIKQDIDREREGERARRLARPSVQKSDTYSDRPRHRAGNRDRDKDRDKDRNTNRDRDKDSERYKHRDRDGASDRDRDTPRQKERERVQEGQREQERERERQRKQANTKLDGSPDLRWLLPPPGRSAPFRGRMLPGRPKSRPPSYTGKGWFFVGPSPTEEVVDGTWPQLRDELGCALFTLATVSLHVFVGVAPAFFLGGLLFELFVALLPCYSGASSPCLTPLFHGNCACDRYLDVFFGRLCFFFLPCVTSTPTPSLATIAL